MKAKSGCFHYTDSQNRHNWCSRGDQPPFFSKFQKHIMQLNCYIQMLSYHLINWYFSNFRLLSSSLDVYWESYCFNTSETMQESIIFLEIYLRFNTERRGATEILQWTGCVPLQPLSVFQSHKCKKLKSNVSAAFSCTNLGMHDSWSQQWLITAETNCVHWLRKHKDSSIQ